MRAVLALLLLLISGPVLADPAVLKDGDILRGRFVQERHMQGFANPIRSEGDFVVAPGRGLIWRAQTPFAVTTVVTNAGLVQSVNGTETTRLAASRLPFLSRLYDMMAGALAGDWHALDGVFVVGRAGNTVTLTPKGDDDRTGAQIAGITATLGRFVDGVEIRKPNGDFDRLRFSDQLLNTRPLDAAEAGLLK
ncbi:hypothetical protein CU669_16220 [Paramagnetospirillum kuznetsovii]|uniref:Outer membrane lipoprotein carrier protein LolA n=1 Tax=Paramagnetospirillum kuznetsovii TaxID=2053833 RepID=A0A364NUR3_9PROT|nr:outer membrane lipoprotein carrier protein LolA [Paramagnetospirillum kuznetsovii]RAU20818.1 hypothetical protein CU669_16220 [Paramagnetospirillum kuznetsovii]